MSETQKPFVSRLVVKLGKPGGPGFEVEFTFPKAATPEEFQKARTAALHDIREWLKEKEPVEPLTVEDVEKLPWKSYKEVDEDGQKKLVGPEHTGWIFWAKEGGGPLTRLIDESPDKKLKLGPYEFAFSGPQKQFIGRKVVEPVEPETESKEGRKGLEK